MSNSFDFELVAGDHVSEAIVYIVEAVRNLEPQLEKTRKGLKLFEDDKLPSITAFFPPVNRSSSTLVSH